MNSSSRRNLFLGIGTQAFPAGEHQIFVKIVLRPDFLDMFQTLKPAQKSSLKFALRAAISDRAVQTNASINKSSVLVNIKLLIVYGGVGIKRPPR